MKKLTILLGVLLSITAISCRSHDHNISLTYSNTDHYYSMKASFAKERTRDVEKYLDRKLGSRSNASFVNTQMDATIGLDDETLFYIKKSPGYLQIKLDKDRNSEEAYERIKSLCEGIKTVVTAPM